MNRFKFRLMVGVAAVGALCASSAAFAGDACSVTFDQNGVETVVITGQINGPSHSFSCSGDTFFTATYDTALVFNPATVTTRNVDLYTTELVGKLDGGTILYDHTFNSAFNAPEVQSGVTAAMAAITTAGGPGVVITSPKLVSHTVTTSTASSSVYTVAAVATSQTAATYVGPGTFPGLHYYASGSTDGGNFIWTVTNPELAPALPGQNTVCTPVLSTANDITVDNNTVTTVPVGTVLAEKPVCTANVGGSIALDGGQTQINLNTTTTFTIDTATTDTVTTTTAEVYDIDGVSVHGIGMIHAVAPVAVFDQSEGFAGRAFEALSGGAWLTPWGSRGTTAARGSVAGDRRDAWGMDGGLARNFGPLRLGMAIDTGSTDLTLSDGSERGRLDMAGAGVFAQVGSATGWGLSLGAGQSGGKVRTSVNVPGFADTAQAHEKISEQWLAAEVRDTLKLGRWTVTPNAGMTSAKTDLKGFSESGSMFDLSGGAASPHRTREWAGVDLAYAVGAKLNLSAGIKAVHFTGAVTPSRPVAYVAFPDVTGLSETAPVARANGASLDLGLDYQATPAIVVSLSGSALMRDDRADTSLWAGIRAAF